MARWDEKALLAAALFTEPRGEPTQEILQAVRYPPSGIIFVVPLEDSEIYISTDPRN
jgi:hypothetical protein